MGGSTDVDAAFVWLIKNSGGGDILVLRASGANGYDDYIYGLGRVNSVSTIVCNSKDASTDPFVLEKINNCEGLFFAGGDQSIYVSYWKNTPVEDAVNRLINQKRVTIGGTSAGMAIQPQFAYTGEVTSITSPEALNNPYHRGVTIATDFIYNPLLQNVITDTHFYERDRMGRLVTFIARLEQDGQVTRAARAVACDEATAVIVTDDGYGTVINQNGGLAYFLYATRAPTVCRSGVPLTFEDVEVVALRAGEEFDFVNWSTTQGRKYYLNANVGVLTSVGNGGRIY